MKHLLTLTALLISSLAMAQMPYNPDSNGDDLIGSEDLLTFLGVYNTLLIDSSLTCDYEGTDLETALVGLITQDYILDSVYVEYVIHDTNSYYTPGCPDVIVDPIVLERSFMMTNSFWNPEPYVGASKDHFGFNRNFYIGYLENTNEFYVYLSDNEVAQLPSYSDGSFLWDPSSEIYTVELSLPFPSNWYLNADGLQVDWREDDWVNKCEHFRLIPYWHEAE